MATRPTPALLAVLCLCAPAAADDADGFFDPGGVREIRLTFSDSNWFNTLQQSHATDPADPYFPCRFEADGIVIDPCGVRMKGNSSFGYPGVKKPFKFDFDEYAENDPNLNFHGLKKLSLNNNFKDPSALRERLFHEFVSQWVPTLRTVSCRLYINGQYWGLYNAAEAATGDFVRSRFGSDEDGNLYEAEHVIGSNAPSDLTWLGTDPTLYWGPYELETNTTANDYSSLIEFINILNNTTIAQMQAQLPALADIDALLRAIALNNLFVNLDSYNGSEHNYFIYERTDTGLFTHIHWDANEAFGNFRSGIPVGQDPRLIPALFLPQGGGGGVNPHPLMERLWAVEPWKRLYLRHLARFLREGFDAATVQARAHALADIIRAAVYADPNDIYTTAQFETNLDSDVVTGNSTIYGLTAFVQARAAYLDTHLNTFASRDDLQLNEVMALNASTLADQAGDFDPWVEIHNLGPGLVNLSDVFLTDTTSNPGKWPVPPGSLNDGLFLLCWIDGEPGEGTNHASFSLSPAGGTIYLYKRTSGVFGQVGSVTYPPATADVSWGRTEEWSAAWAASDQPTPGAPNTGSASPLAGKLMLNELMAANTSTIADEAGDFADWLELYNASNETLAIGGAFLTDEMMIPTQWMIPAGTTLAPGAHLLVWCDQEPAQGPLHASFKLSAGGETLALFAADGETLLDAISFPALGDDVSYGRLEDGGPAVATLDSPSPGAPNSVSCPGDLNDDTVVDASDLGQLLGAWGAGAGSPEDLDGDGSVSAGDLGVLLGAWGTCP